MENLVRGFRGLSLEPCFTLAAGVGPADIVASNGVIHVTDKTILPGS